MEEIEIQKYFKSSILLLIVLVISGLQTTSSNLPMMVSDPVSENSNTSSVDSPLIDSQIVDSTITDNKINGQTSGSQANSKIINPQTHFDSSQKSYSQLDTSQGSISQANLPDYLYTWSNFSSTYHNVVKSPFLQIYQDTLVKVNQDNQIETVVKSTQGITPEISSLFQQYHVSMIQEYPMLGVYKVSVDARLLDAFISDSKVVNGILYAQPSYYYRASFTPNDPEFVNQYGPQIIGMESAWDTQLGNTSVLVAVIDTGIDYTHPDLGNYVPIGYDWFNNDSDPFDDNGHGTHVAGTIGATIDNGVGIAGIADVSFFAEKFLDSGGYGSDIDAANAIIHAVDSGAQILSNSWGGYGESAVLSDAINYAVSHGVIVVAAAGNFGSSTPFYPAAYPGVIAVTATDSADNFAGFSNFGNWVDIAAPGVNILSTVPWGYDYFSGTSMATPHVSGLLALLKSQFPTYNADLLENLLFASATDLGAPGFDDYFGWGRIDASSAIIGLQEFNAKASLSVPSIIPFDLPSDIIARVTNIGTSDLTDVNLELSIDGLVVNSSLIPFLPSGSSFDLPYSFLPSMIGDYNISVSVSPLPGENVLSDNEVYKIVTASAKIINPQVGDVIAYGTIGGDTPYYLKWVITDTSNPLAYMMDLWFFDEGAQQEFWADTFTLNPYTREYSSIYFPQSGFVFPYWVQTDLQIGDTFDLFAIGAQDGHVVNETIVDYYGIPTAVWVVDDGSEYALLSQSSGILVALRDYNYQPTIYDLMYSNALPEAYNLVNQRMTFYGSVSLVVGQSSDIIFLMQNTGTDFLNIQMELYINGAFYGSTGYGLGAGEYSYVYFPFTAPSLGSYDLFAQLLPVTGENYYDDNYAQTNVTLVQLENYGLSYPAYSWYDAVSNGFNLNMFGDDTSTQVDIPFVFDFYDQGFSTLYVSSNGWMSFVNTNPYDFVFPGYPNTNYPYSMALFWDDLIAEGNVYAWVTSDFVVIEYSNYNYLWGDLAGTFEVILFNTGEILFQYQYVNYESNTGKGVNYGANSNYYTVLPDSLGGQSNFAALFTRGGVSEGPDLRVGATIPPDLEPGQLGLIQAYVQNIGTGDAQGVEFFLYIDGVEVGSAYAQSLPGGESLTLTHYWIPDYPGQHLIEVAALPVSGESNTENNYFSDTIIVGAYHDLATFVNVYQQNGHYVLEGSVVNYGENPEYNVELFLYIDGNQVSGGMIDSLATMDSYTIRYTWDPTGPAEVSAFTPVRPYEDNVNNNLAVQYFDPGTGDATIVVSVMDSTTGDPIQSAYVFYGGNNNYYDGFTDAYGNFATNVTAGDYYINVQKDGYVPYDNYVTVNSGDFLWLYVYLDPLTGNETVYFEAQVVDYNTNQPLENAQIYIQGDNTTEYGYTDINGIYSTMLTLGAYYVEASLPGYMNQSLNIFIDNPNYGYGVYFSLVPENSSPQELYILSPTPGEVVDGALVDVHYDATNVYDIVAIDVFVNDQYITTVDFLVSQSFYVPVFQEGLNTITLYANYWTGAVATANVTIQSVNLIQYLTPEVGDYYNFEFTILMDQVITTDFDFTVFAWVSENEVWLNLTYTQYRDGVFDLTVDFNLVVNVLNGYVSYSDMWWANQHFYPLSGLVDPMNAQLGDSFPFWSWGNKLTIVGQSTWNGLDTWVFTDYFGSLTGGVAKENGLFLWYDIPGNESGQLLDSSWLPGSVAPPVVSDAPDMVYELGSVGNSITWVATSDSPLNYTVLRDGSIIDGGDWISGQNITVNIDGLDGGFHFFEIYVVDTNGNYAYDSVSVFVQDTTPPSVTTDSNISYDYGTTGNVITIYAFDLQPNNYTVFKDGSFYSSDSWQNDVPIVIDIDGLETGTYQFSVFIMDLWGNGVDVDITVEVLDTTPPTVRAMPDFTYEEGSIDNYIRWTASVDQNGSYLIYRDGDLISNGLWTALEPVEINIDGLEVGRYNFTALFFDTHSNMKENTVIVYVIPSQEDLPHGAKKVPGFESWIAFIALVAIPIIRKRRITQ